MPGCLLASYLLPASSLLDIVAMTARTHHQLALLRQRLFASPLAWVTYLLNNCMLGVSHYYHHIIMSTLALIASHYAQLAPASATSGFVSSYLHSAFPLYCLLLVLLVEAGSNLVDS